MTFERLTQWQVHDAAGRRKYLSEDERQRFLAIASSLSPPARALCYVLLLTGCRPSEALALHRHQLDTDRLALTFRTLKRRRVVFRVVPIPADLVAMLLALPAQPDGRFWTIHRGTAWRIVKRTMRQAAIVGPMACCKGLRHAFCMRAAARNVPPNLIQRWAGHSSAFTTAIYIDAVGNEEREFAKRMW